MIEPEATPSKPPPAQRNQVDGEDTADDGLNLEVTRTPEEASERRRGSSDATQGTAFTPRPFADTAEFSLDEAIVYIGNGNFQVRLLVCVGVFMITTALQFSILSFLGFIVQCEIPEWGVTDGSAAALSTLLFFGMLVGTPFWGSLSDNYGRKPVSYAVETGS